MGNIEIPEGHLDPTTEITFEAVKARTVKGVAVLTGRTFILSLISLVAIGFLTVFLDPSEFGVFWIVSAIVNFLAYFSDVGLAAALIQKKEKISKADLNTTFLIQQILVLLLLTLLYILSPFLQNYYGFSQNGKFLLFALGFSLFLSSLKTIPSILLERELEFGKWAIPQVIENVVYNMMAVYFAWRGYGVISFAYAVIARGVIGLVIIYIIRPWFPSFVFSKKALKKLLTFGVPYQTNTFLAVIKDDGMTVFLGGILGPVGIGLLGWAQKWAQYPLRL
ncbi:oligosaccharide flippase family protein, partial [Patescibacteria group bacterium]|nr:oligosaccharide flippase family protein [Patescibacteria group bacterium]